jgi:hypothetical protein
MYETPDTQDPQGLDEGIETPTKKQPKSGRKGKVDSSKETNLLARVENAKTNIQKAKLDEVRAFSEVASDDFIDLADKFTALGIVEKMAGSIHRAGNMATSFLRSTPATGTYLEDALTSTIDMEDPFLMLMEA